MGDDNGMGIMIGFVCVPVGLLLLLLCSILFTAGVSEGVAREQRKAIEAGVGRWSVNASTGELVFVYGKVSP